LSGEVAEHFWQKRYYDFNIRTHDQCGDFESVGRKSSNRPPTKGFGSRECPPFPQTTRKEASGSNGYPRSGHCGLAIFSLNCFSWSAVQ
jgi:hypothetical protein